MHLESRSEVRSGPRRGPTRTQRGAIRRRPNRDGRRRAGRDADAVAARCRRLEAVVALAFRLSLDELRGSSRGHAPIAFARQVAMYVAHVWFALTFSEVGRCFDRDRTTVAHACRVVEERRDDPRVDRVVAAIESATELWDDFAALLEAAE